MVPPPPHRLVETDENEGRGGVVGEILFSKNEFNFAIDVRNGLDAAKDAAGLKYANPLWKNTVHSF